ncbi:MAG TPA: phosphatidylserine decarboxylase family protein [Acidobacteriota bacterium]|nr:phosphatidylserine decarboxylase family protein [Acidobacteriota bacterium]
MARDVYKFCIPVFILCVLFFILSCPLLAVICLLLASFICYFFRNPKREIPPGNNLVVSPADGKVVKILELPDGATTISIFLNIFNVHVNRSPISGRLEQLEYKRGKFKVAFDEEASKVNEQNILTISGENSTVVVRQIAGLIARRVICWKKPGDSLDRGELIGLIRFGSRVDVTVPERVRIQVKIGDRVRGGSSILGEYA